LKDVDGPVRRDGIGQTASVGYYPPVNEDIHVSAQSTLVVQNIASGTRIICKEALQNFPHGRAIDARLRTRDVALDVWGEYNASHGQILQAQKMIAQHRARVTKI
jgi:hypothetical protein